MPMVWVGIPDKFRGRNMPVRELRKFHWLHDAWCVALHIPTLCPSNLVAFESPSVSHVLCPFDSLMMPARNLLSRLPLWLSRWLGYRQTPPPKQPPYVIWAWSFVGAFCGLSVLQAIFEFAPYFVDRQVPSIIASYVSESPQPSEPWYVLREHY